MHRFFSLILGLVVALGACAPQPETAVPTPIPSSIASHQAAVVMPLLTLEEYGFQFLYPPQYQAVIFQNGLCLSSAREYGRPGPCHVQNFGIDVMDAEGRSLEQAADEAAATGNPEIEVKRTRLTVAGEEAVLLDDIYAVDLLRKVVIVHTGRIYTLTFLPWSVDQDDSSPMVHLYNTVINSFTFLDQPVP